MNNTDLAKYKNDFPIFKRTINGKKLVYLDSSATSQKPQVVIDSLVDFYSNHNANVGRSTHTLAEEASAFMEKARKKTKEFINAYKSEEIVFTKNSTEALNMVANLWGIANLKSQDVILIAESEHNSNLLPWLNAAKLTGATVTTIPVNTDGQININEFTNLLTSNVKVVVLSHVSNVLGTIFPIKDLVKAVKKNSNAIVVVDGSQAVSHISVNVQSLECDFYTFSAHKMLGPMGVGVLWGKFALLNNLSPYLRGGGMVVDIKPDEPIWQEVPHRFEAGTPNVAGIVAMGTAIEYISSIGVNVIRNHDVTITEHALRELQKIPGLVILGPKDANERVGLVSFTIESAHSHDIAAVLNFEGIAVRSGTHCAMRFHNNRKISASTRVSFHLYNTIEDVDTLIAGLNKAMQILK